MVVVVGSGRRSYRNNLINGGIPHRRTVILDDITQESEHFGGIEDAVRNLLDNVWDVEDSAYLTMLE